MLRAAETMAACITATLTEPPPSDFAADDYGPRSTRWYAQSLSRGAAGVAILHGVRAQTRTRRMGTGSMPGCDARPLTR